jgi:hypothetical protein
MKIIFYLTCLLPTIYVYVGETSFVAFPEKTICSIKNAHQPSKFAISGDNTEKCNEKFDLHRFEAIESSDGLALKWHQWMITSLQYCRSSFSVKNINSFRLYF